MLKRSAALVLATAAVMTATAGTASAGGNGAEVVRDGGQCLTTSSTGAAWLFSCSFTIVFAPNGNITQRISGSVIPESSSPLPSRAVTDVVGGPCLVLDGQVITRVVAGVVTPSGQAQLTCKN